MRFWEFVRFSLGGLWRQKARSSLTIIGVTVGASSLAFSLSLGVGLLKVVLNEFHSRPGFWEIQVRPGQSRPAIAAVREVMKIAPGLNPERTARLEAEREHEERRVVGGTEIPLTPEKLAEIRNLTEIVDVQTLRHYHGQIRLGEQKHRSLFFALNCDRPEFQKLLVAGRLPRNTSDREVVVSERLLYELGLRTEAAFERALGQTLTVELGFTSEDRQLSFLRSVTPGFAGSVDFSQAAVLLKLLSELPKLLDHSSLTYAEKEQVKGLFAPPATKVAEKPYGAAESYTIVGIRRSPTQAEHRGGSLWQIQQHSVFASSAGGEDIFRRLHSLKDGRFDQAIVKVRPGSDLPAVVAKIESHGFGTQSSLTWYNGARREVTAIAVGLNVFSWISLIVAAVGITNTLVTNVIERTREIGILKAVGATRRQILGIFVLEGTLIGTLGGLLGLLIARVAAIPADGLVRHEIQKQMRGETMLSTQLFEFPLWLCAVTVGSAAIITTVAAIYPARRASRVNPVEALKAM
jgi:putative ABC transport system permease protein